MAKIEEYLAFLKRWEGGVAQVEGDRGGLTNRGLTLRTFRRICPNATDDMLRAMSEEMWADVVRWLCWDVWKADTMADQRVAMMLADWLWMSGTVGVKMSQVVLGVVPDGLVGPKTLAAVAHRDADKLLHALYEARIRHFNRIVTADDAQLKFLRGWTNRVRELAGLPALTKLQFSSRNNSSLSPLVA